MIKRNSFIENNLIIITLILISLSVFALTWVSIKESRSDSFQLMVMEGKAFIEALTSSAENAMSSENFYDFLAHKRYQEIVIELAQNELDEIDETRLSQIAISHDLYSVFVYNIDSQLVAGTVIRGSNLQPPEHIYDDIKQLISRPEENYVLILEEGEQPDDVVHYYMEITNRMDRVVLLVADAYYFLTALEQTEIGYLAEKMARESGVEYIVHQDLNEIIFSSLRTGEMALDSSDIFLSEAAQSDTVMFRKYNFQDEEILEIVRPFATVKSPTGLLRVGLSLKSYQAIVKSFDQQMIIIGGALIGFIIVIVLYLSSRTKRKIITEEYQKIKSISDKIFDEMKTGVVAIDKNGELYLANNAFYNIVRKNRIDVKKWDDCWEQTDLKYDVLIHNFEQTYEKEISLERNGEISHLLLIISVVNDLDNEINGFVAVISDITDLKELEKKTSRRERLSEMGNLAAGVAHEIRNPLNSISIAAQRLAGEFTPVENRQEFIDFTKQIKDETKRLNEIITRFLALTREDLSNQTEFDLSRSISDFIQFIKPQADNNKISLKCDLKDNVIMKGSADNLKQVLLNLFNNSVEAIDGDEGKINISLGEKEDKYVLVFEDSGPGIPKAEYQKVFTPYYTTKDAGTGLGLPTVHKIITQMEGEIELSESNLGGAKFVFTFEK